MFQANNDQVWHQQHSWSCGAKSGLEDGLWKPYMSFGKVTSVSTSVLGFLPHFIDVFSLFHCENTFCAFPVSVWMIGYWLFQNQYHSNSGKLIEAVSHSTNVIRHTCWLLQLYVTCWVHPSHDPHCWGTTLIVIPNSSKNHWKFFFFQTGLPTDSTCYVRIM